MDQAPIIYRVVDLSDHSVVGLTVGEDRLEDLIRTHFQGAPAEVSDAIDTVLDRHAGLESQTLLDVHVESPRVDDLTDEEWGLLVWEACRDGGTWVEDDRTTVQILARTGTGSGLSRVASQLNGEHRVVVTRRGSEPTERIVDGLTEGWAGVRRVVRDRRHAAVLVEVQRAQDSVRSLESRLAQAKQVLSQSVREATEEGVSGPTLARVLGVTRARVYQLRDGR